MSEGLHRVNASPAANEERTTRQALVRKEIGEDKREMFVGALKPCSSFITGPSWRVQNVTHGSRTSWRGIIQTKLGFGPSAVGK